VKDYITLQSLTFGGSGTSSFVPDRLNNPNGALYLNNAFYSVPSGVYFSGPFTVMGWLYIIEFTTDSAFLSFGNGASNDNIYLGLSNGGSPFYGIFSGSDELNCIGPGNALPLNIWVHYCGTWNGTYMAMYVNGTSVASATVSGQVKNVTRTQNYIGQWSWPGNPYANAYFDEIRIYNR